MKATLTEKQIDDLTAWALAEVTVGGVPKFKVRRGEGTGDYEAKDQLKIISRLTEKISGGKKPTFHITLRL